MQVPTPANDNEIDPLLKLSDVMTATRQGSSTIYRKIATGTFPKPLRLGPGSVRWRTSAIVGWVNGLDQALAA
jgi:prophage regulatory protein